MTTVTAAVIVAVPSLFIEGAIVAVLLASLLLTKELTDVRERGTAMEHALLNGALLAFGAVFVYDIGMMLLF